MSGDVQTRQRRKEKRKQKRDEPAIGVDTAKINESEKKNVQMHVGEDHDHGVGWCAKVVFFLLMAVLASLVGLIVLENRGGSDLDTPLSQSRFSEYLQGWVDETREDDHHDEPHFSPSDDDHHDEDEGDNHDAASLAEDEPYPEEKDNSTPEDNNDSEEELNAEINLNESEPDQTESQDADDNDSQMEPETQEAEDSNDDDEDDKDGSRGDQVPETDVDSEANDDVPSLYEDSTPFEEERTNILPDNKLKGSDLEQQVDELIDTYNEIAEMLGKEKVSVNVHNVSKALSSKEEDNDDNFEDVVDNDAGEDLLLKKIAEQKEAEQQQQSQESSTDEPEDEGSSSLGVKLGVGVLLAIVAHQIIIKKISATNRSEPEVVEPNVDLKRHEELLNKRRLTMLSGSEGNLIDEDLDNEEIIEVMMVRGHNLTGEGEVYTDSELGEEEEEEEDEIYSDEADHELQHEARFVPKTFEDFQTLFKSQFEPAFEIEENIAEEEPMPVDQEMEEHVEQVLMRKPQKTPIAKGSPEPEPKPQPIEAPLEDDYEPEDYEPEELELSDEELVDEEEIDYEDEESEEISEVDDDDLMKRLEAKYGKISGENSEDEDDPDGTWTKLEGGAQSYMDELLKENENLENQPEIKELFEKAKSLDAQAEKERSNIKLIEAVAAYKHLIVNYTENLNDTIMKEISARCIERMRFIGKLKAAVDVHKKLIERFPDEPDFRNQLAVTYLLGNHLSVAKLVLHETLIRWRYNGFALVHYGFVLKNLDQDYENAVLYLQEGIDTDEPGTQDGRFYFNLGDALQRLGRNEEALKVYRKGAQLGLFLNEYQRSLYNVDRLKSTPFWTKVQTTYKDELVEIQKYWQIIRDEGLKLLSQESLFTKEAENLKDTGDWKQFELFARGVKTKNCKLAPITCKVIESFTAASSCKRGQVKFSVLHPGTHVFSHCGPTNCRIRCHLGLKVPEKTFIRVADETRSWAEGEWLIFDDSFEHEVWHNGTSVRLVLIVDVWHPELTDDEKQYLSPI